jgi:hypothetical protein
MPRTRYSAEEIVNKLREADVALAQGMTAVQASRTRHGGGGEQGWAGPRDRSEARRGVDPGAL